MKKFVEFNPTKNDIKRYIHFKSAEKSFKNNVYEVLLNQLGKYIHLRIHRIDNKPIHNCLELQEIKNKVLGENVIAIEVYPKQVDYKNGSHTYHLWTWKNIEVPNLKNFKRYH